ncbi:MAG: DNA methyltransferase [Pseudomonadota bacterium]|nr:MAG: hypothetical protein DIU78_06680 [Pseudomonadota bacterium]
MVSDLPEAARPPRARQRRRKALTHVGGRVEVHTRDPELARVLVTALDVRPDEERVLAHVHGFHSYPARMHPDTAGALARALSPERGTVLDPFCGSGTVLVAARELGRVALGSDLNPLAVRLARLKLSSVDEGFVRALNAAAERVAEHALARKAAELGPTHPYGPEDRELFAPHVLLELDGLRDGIDQIAEREIASALRLVLSALLTKVSVRRGDSSAGVTPKRIAGGFTIRFFVKKTRELGERLLEAERRRPKRAPVARVEIADARRLGFVRDRSVDLVLSSPPYPGVYDYFEHHRLRLRWLRLDGRELRRSEIGARRTARSAAEAIAAWERDFGRCLAEMARVLRPNGHVALLLADSTVGGRALRVERWLPEFAARADLDVVGRAAQPRPHFHAPSSRAFATRPRFEHLVILKPGRSK